MADRGLPGCGYVSMPLATSAGGAFTTGTCGRTPTRTVHSARSIPEKKVLRDPLPSATGIVESNGVEARRWDLRPSIRALDSRTVAEGRGSRRAFVLRREDWRMDRPCRSGAR